MIHNRQILVTGGAGFIGSHLVDRLAEENDVTVLDDFSTGQRENVPAVDSVELVEGSVTDANLVADIVDSSDVVVHLAAMMGVRRTLDQPLDVLEVNIDGTRTVLSAVADADVNRVVVASTSEVYGDAPNPPYAEDDETAPKTNYAVAKLADERFTRAYSEEYGLEYTILRYFNVYGPKQDASEYGYVVPIFVRQALAADPITVHGTGVQTRDFTFINDAVDGTIRALGPEGKNETFNVGTGIETSIRELATTVRDVVGRGSIKQQDHPRPYTVERRCADISKARSKLDYEPQWSIEEGVRQLVERAKHNVEEGR